MTRLYPRFLLIILAAALLAGCSNSARETAEDLRPAGVRVTTVARGDIETIIAATGTIAPRRESFLGPKVSGRIERLCVDEGDRVAHGDPLLQLEQVRFRLSLQEARAACSESRAQLANLKQKLARTRELFDKGVTDKQLLDDMVTDFELARARAEVAAARLERAEVDLRDSTLLAPFSGFIVERRMNTGEIFSGMAGEYVFHLVDTGTVNVEVNIFETKKQYVTLGKQVTVLVDAVPGKAFTGAITVVNQLVDPVSRKFLVKIEIPNPEAVLEPGMFARVRIPEESRAGVLTVPSDALIERDGETVVFVAREDVARKCRVQTGLATHERVEITSGLNPGERVIVDGLYAVKDGTPLLVEQQP